MAADEVALTDVLDCVSALFTVAGNVGPDDRPQLEGIILGERERFTNLLAALFRFAEGTLLDATTCGAGVDSYLDPEAEAAELVEGVREVLEAYNGFTPRADLHLELAPGRAAIVGAVDYAAANTGQRALRELATAVLSAELAATSLNALIWADDSLDDEVREIVWKLVTRLHRLIPMQEGSSLLLVAGDADLDPKMHCAGPQGIRFNIQSWGREQRRPQAESCQIVRELTRPAPSAAPLVQLFLGAGASLVDGLPTGNALRDEALAYQCEVARVDRSNYDTVARQFFHLAKDYLSAGERQAGENAFVSTLTLERVLQVEQAQEHNHDCRTIRYFRREHHDIAGQMAVRQAAGDYTLDPLVRLLALQRRLVLVTVNFDQVIETKAPGLVRPFVTEDDLSVFADYLAEYASAGGPVPLLKLHGDIEVPDSIVADTSQTMGGLSRTRIEALEHLIATVAAQEFRPWWYVGYSMRDLDLEPIWSNANFADSIAERWVAPFLDPAVGKFIDRYRATRWGNEGHPYTAVERLVALTAADFFEEFATRAEAAW